MMMVRLQAWLSKIVIILVTDCYWFAGLHPHHTDVLAWHTQTFLLSGVKGATSSNDDDQKVYEGDHNETCHGASNVDGAPLDS